MEYWDSGIRPESELDELEQLLLLESSLSKLLELRDELEESLSLDWESSIRASMIECL